MAELMTSIWRLFQPAMTVINPVWPYVAAILLLLLVLASLYLLVTMVAALIRRRVLSRQFRAQRPAAGATAAVVPAAAEIERFAVLPDGVSTASLERSFADVLDLLKRHVPNRQFRYQIPWFVSIGDTGAGKTTLFASAPIHRPFSDPGTLPQAGASCSWWFYDNAIVLDVAGRTVLSTGGRAPQGTGWRRFIKLLQASRPQRPLDGLILSVSARDLLDQGAEGSNALLQKAETLHNQLWELQKLLEINFPIYVIVTQCDALDGFPEFCAALPADFSLGMLGWSSPYGVEAAYNPRWINEIFDETLGDIGALETDLYLNPSVKDRWGRMALLPESFRALRRPMEQFLTRIFMPTAYHEVFVLRGVYFTGAMAEVADRYPVLSAPARSPWSEDRAALAGQQGGVPSIAFVRDLLDRKIFQETGLAKPISRALYVSTRRTRLAQATLAGTAAALTAVTIYESAALADRVRIVDTTVEETRRDIIRFEERAKLGSLGAEPAADPLTISRLLASIVLVERDDLSTPLFPTSLFSGVDGNMERLVGIAADRMMLKPLRSGLLQQLSGAVSGTGPGGAVAPGGGDAGRSVNMDSRAAPRSIEQLPGYQRLSGYINHLSALRENLDRYDRLRRSGSFADLASLTQYVFGVSPPSILKDNERFRSAAIREANLQEINVDPLQAAAGVGARQFAEDLYDDLFARNGLAFWTKRLEGQVRDLRANAVTNHISAKDIQELQYSYRQLRSAAEASVNGWLLAPEPTIPKEIETLLGRIAVSVLLSNDTFEDISRTIATRSLALREEMLGLEMPLVGRVFMQGQAGAPFQLSNRFLELFDPIDVLLSQGFMTDMGQAPFPTPGEGSQFVWDTSLLNQAKQLREDYSAYVAQRLSDFPKPLHAAVRLAAGRRMVSNVLTLSARAVSVSEGEEKGPAVVSDRALADQVASFLTVAPAVQELTDGIRPHAEPGATRNLEDLLSAQSVQILKRVSGIIASEDPYRPLTENTARWDGEPGAFTRAYSAANGGELAALLGAARQRIRVLARSYAKPALDYIKDPYRLGALGIDRTAQDWRDILGALDRYDQQIPNNSLSELEKFVLFVGNAVGRDNCREVLAERLGTVGGGDYFARVHIRAMGQLNDRCSMFQNQQVQMAMGQLGNSFNQLLAGHFPFVTPQQASTAPDADPADIRRFYALYDELKPRIDKELAAAKGRISPLKGFVDQVESARAFFADIIDPAGSGTMRLTADITFGVNRINEIGGDQIIEWAMKAGASTASSAGGRTLQWSYSEPVELRLRWASGSNQRPYREANRPGAPMVDGDSAIIVEKGPWSLLRLLVGRGIANPELADPTLRGQQVVRVAVPTRSLTGVTPQDAVVFIAARVKAGAEGKPPVRGIPAFPTRFPDIRVAGF